jgi:uncharacterized delta-60 repeat protein
MPVALGCQRSDALRQACSNVGTHCATTFGGSLWHVHWETTMIRVTLIALLPACLAGTVWAHSFDPTFQVQTDGNVYTAVVQPDGKILIGGSFTQVNGVDRDYIARLNNNGTVDTTFDAGPIVGNGFEGVWCISLLFGDTLATNDQIYIGGGFTEIDGTSICGVARLEMDGTLDTSFDAGLWPAAWVTSILQSSGIWIAGQFSPTGGIPFTNLMRVDQSGNPVPNTDIGDGSNGMIYTLGLEWNRPLTIAGMFTSYDGQSADRIASLTYSGGRTTQLPVSFGSIAGNPVVTSLVKHPDGTTLVAGSIDTVSGATRHEAAHLGETYQVLPTYDATGQIAGSVRQLLLQSDGKLLLGGSVQQAGSANVPHLVRIDENGNLDASLQIGTGANDMVMGMTMMPEGDILVYGRFDQFDGTATNVARLTTSQPTQLQLSPLPDGTVEVSFEGAGPTINQLTLEYWEGTGNRFVSSLEAWNGTGRVWNPLPMSPRTLDVVVAGRIHSGHANGSGAFTEYYTQFDVDSNLQVTRDAAAVNHGATDNLGERTVGQTITLTYELRNVGAAYFEGVGLQPFRVVNTVNCTATVMSQPASVINPGQTEVLVIEILPEGEGAFHFDVEIEGNGLSTPLTTWTATGDAELPGSSGDSSDNGCAVGPSTKWPLGVVALAAIIWAHRRQQGQRLA